MTEEEAIKKVKEFGLHHAIGDLPNSALTVKAFEMAVAALEKQIPKKPVQGEPYNWIDSVRVGRRYRNVKKTSYSHACPNCGDTVVQLRNKYCSKCGQAIDWSENNGE